MKKHVINTSIRTCFKKSHKVGGLPVTSNEPLQVLLFMVFVRAVFPTTIMNAALYNYSLSNGGHLSLMYVAGSII